MEKCKSTINSRNQLLGLVHEDENAYSKSFKTSTSSIKECFTEYSLEDKVEALRNIFVHNERHTQKLPPIMSNIHNSKRIIDVKECLQPDEETSFQTIISELRNTVMNSYWNKEVGKTRYQISNLPVGMKPLEVTFGKKLKSGETMGELLKQEIIESDIPEQNIFEMYKKSHNSYLPAEQIKRQYKKPFDQNSCFGKLWNANTKGERLKRLLTWIIADPDHSHSRIGEVKDIMNIINDKVYEKKGISEMLNILSDCPINNEVVVQQGYLQYINSLRLKLKKHVPEIPFLDIYEDLLSLDKDYTNILSEDKVFSILAKYKIYINKTFLTPILDLLQIRKEENVKYEELLNLLNWKYDFPTLPKIEKIPSECQRYSTTYNTTIGNIESIDITNIPAAGISYVDLDRCTAYSLILPNIFTKHGLIPTDLSRLRNKEEIKNIFETIGIRFPNNTFDLLWKKGQEKSYTDNVSIEIFGSLLDQYDDLIDDKNN
ncbi:EF-hand domain-containing family member B [Bombus vosnesenskii]|uniref:EF-hand domain-containing family member B n=1 Tax=Bombus vosnesenskii TaxID=207650 RepID=A0A6J3KKD5_9HYME|nr:EF-hand domain-containing family member B [Bombus vosnesenskii]